MSITKYLMICLLGMGCGVAQIAFSQDWDHAGFLYDEFSLTLEPGHRTEILGPLFYSDQKESQHQWALPPLLVSHAEDPVIDDEEFDFAYPVLTYDRFGAEYRWQIFQVFSFAGGANPDDSSTRRFTLFPIYFQQRSTDSKQDYTALVPFYGHLNHRLFRDDIDFVCFPFYSKTRKKDVWTCNMPYPFFHLRYGDNLRGWQIWPFYGRERKGLTTITNTFGELKPVGGHDNRFVVWPFFVESTNGIGTDDVVRQKGLIPFYSLYRSKLRESTSYGWPIGVTRTVDDEKKYRELDAPWPVVEFAHGEGKTEQRVWPFYSVAHNQTLTDNWFCWPVYKYNHVTSAPLDRERTRIFFFLFSDVKTKNTADGRAFHRDDLWPLFTHRHEFNGNERLQVLAILEPFFPNNKSIERDYSPLYSLWRAEKNPKSGAASQSLLWNLYRRETAPQHKKISLLFGLFQYQSSGEGSRWRVCYIPVGGKKSAAPKSPPRQ